MAEWKWFDSEGYWRQTMRILILPLLAVALIQGAPVWSMPTQSVNLDLGMGVPLADADVSNAGGGKATIGSTGVTFGGQYLRSLPSTPDLAVGGEFNYFVSGNNNSTSFIANANSTVNSTSVAFLGIAKYSFLTEGKVLPYLLGGLGFGQASWKITAAPVAGKVWSDTGTAETRTLLDNGGWSYALAFGGGVDVPINESWLWGAELRWQQIGSRTYSTTASGQALGVTGLKGAFNDFHLTAHASYRF